MRFRLTTRLPLKPLKAWFDLTDSELGLDISRLKTLICGRLSQLCDESGNAPSPATLELSIDEFALLDDSKISVIRENDLVCISERMDVRSPRKRKASEPNSGVSLKKRKIVKELPVSDSDGQGSSSISSSASSTSSSEESSSSDSASESTSESDSESASSSSASSSHSPVEAQSSKPKPLLPSKSTATSISLVPPGQGTQATRGRNARRRLKRLHEKTEMQKEQAASLALSTGSANSIPLGVRPSASQPNYISIPQQALAMTPNIQPSVSASLDTESLSSTLRNKNKKKGFKSTMEGLIPQKIRFTDSVDEQPGSQVDPGNSAPSTSVNGKPQLPRLITPSEKQALGILPPNIFVTSVEVEGERWDKRKKKTQRDAYGNGDGSVDIAHGKQKGTYSDQVVLDYGEADGIKEVEKCQEPEVDWFSVEAKWDKLRPILDISALIPDSLVAWKELAINPTTFSPETLLHLARVKKINVEAAAVSVKLINRPGSRNIAFGATTTEDLETAEVEGELASEDVDYPFTSVQNTWRVVN